MEKVGKTKNSKTNKNSWQKSDLNSRKSATCTVTV